MTEEHGMTMERTLVTYPDEHLFAEAVAARTLLTMNEVLGAHGRERVDVAVTGGTDGTAILRAIAASPLLGVIDWHHVHIWWGDERFVPAGSDERNENAARDALFDGLIASGMMDDAQIHAMPADTRPERERAAATPEQTREALRHAATVYQSELLGELGETAAMDIMMFGVGPDGHFASLFPDHGELAIDDPRTLVVGVDDSPKPPPTRITFTVPMIARTSYLWICGSRAAKADAVYETFRNVRDPHYPASFADATQEVLWITDRASAARLRG